MTKQFKPDDTQPLTEPADKLLPEDIGRRQLFRQAGVFVGASALLAGGRPAAAGQVLGIPEWTTQQGSQVGTLQYGQPSAYEQHVVRRLPMAQNVPSHYVPPQTGSSWSSTPWQDLFGSITPNGLFYERHHAGIPDINPAEHRLVLHGLVEHDLEFTVADLLRFPSVTRYYFLECSGNTDVQWDGLDGKHQRHGRTVQDTHGLLSCAQWTGVLLSTLLAEAGVKLPQAQWILAEGADGAAMARSVPMARAMDDALVVYAQNGERLRPEQGYPIRLLVPGCEGNINIKWLRRLKVSEKPFYTREETSKYTDLVKEGIARKSTLVMEAKSVITWPSGGHKLTKKGTYEIRGIAWSGHGKITHVDVSVDGGRNWKPAALAQPVMSKCLTAFTLQWQWDGQAAEIMSRAVDETGYVQPFLHQLIEVRGTKSEYHNNAIHAWHVSKEGVVTNA